MLLAASGNIFQGRHCLRSIDRKRYVSQALKAYGMLAASADKGAVRVLPSDA